jgi:hypothetical protein
MGIMVIATTSTLTAACKADHNQGSVFKRIEGDGKAGSGARGQPHVGVADGVAPHGGGALNACTL